MQAKDEGSKRTGESSTDPTVLMLVRKMKSSPVLRMISILHAFAIRVANSKGGKTYLCGASRSSLFLKVFRVCPWFLLFLRICGPQTRRER